MTVNFIYKKFFLLPSLSSQSFNQILRLFLLSLIVSTHSVQANDENTESFVTEFKGLTEDNLPEYVSRMSQHYYEQVESLGNYFQLYQQKRDPRGFNVWHLRGFSPSFNALNDQSQQVATANEKFLAERPEQALSTIFAELKEVSVNLMVSFRENDPEAFKLANTKVKEHGEQIATLLKAHNLEAEIREVSLN
ncbi:hypothetical protein [Methylophaga sp.]|uniref:hypothetical protein n=1 Tax=Methylophaga sp. TaxID=2024840 RepID=UPI002727DDE7|nr:hypothetical protein [Methylophaga sp.]MDO8827065.1 hypothetical protein [Methylophaga sp.]